MIVVEVSGGLGNQLFQYAFGEALKQRLGTEAAYDLRGLRYRGPRATGVPRELQLEELGIVLDEATPGQLRHWPQTDPGRTRTTQAVLGKVTGALRSRSHPIIVQPSFHFEELDWHPDAYYRGYWQSERYFAGFSTELKERLQARDPMSLATQELSERIASQASLCVNVRRGDFVTHEGSRSFHGLLDATYYQRGVDHLAKQHAIEQVFVFSDDPEWCEHALDLSVPFEVVGHEHAGPKFAHYLMLMSAASYFVIPNSTFAWWAAWLRDPPRDHVVAPRNWFTDASIDTSDLILEGWVRL